MKKILILTFAFLLVLASCATEGPTTSKDKAFIGGTIGLLIDFVDGEPPVDVTDAGESPFSVSVKIENQGETPIAKEDISLSLKGFDAPSFGTTSAALTDLNPLEDILANEINPDTGDAIESPVVYFTFPNLNFEDILAGNHAFPFQVDLCYEYATRATSTVCIKENLIRPTDDICAVVGPKQIQNSGAPIQIADFQQYSAGQNAIAFTFRVKNMGNGDVYNKDSMCEGEGIANKEIVTLTVDTSIPGLTCSGVPETTAGVFIGDIKLSTGEKQVRCTQQLSDADKTDKIMIVDLVVEYAYHESTSTSVLVKHI
ncbi:MAG: hypothetical protein ABH828_05020 [archaeon]